MLRVKKKIFGPFFRMKRQKLDDCFYFCQTFTRILKHLIRDNANFIFILLFRQDEMNLKYVYDDHINTGMLYPDKCVSLVGTAINLDLL